MYIPDQDQVSQHSRNDSSWSCHTRDRPGETPKWVLIQRLDGLSDDDMVGEPCQHSRTTLLVPSSSQDRLNYFLQRMIDSLPSGLHVATRVNRTPGVSGFQVENQLTSYWPSRLRLRFQRSQIAIRS